MKLPITCYCMDGHETSIPILSTIAERVGGEMVGGRGELVSPGLLIVVGRTLGRLLGRVLGLLFDWEGECVGAN